ncbi:alanyl-tRNA editing protein [Novispirillum itersonii]|uniref:Alanine--tRNA ligase n=1 Tax=Novispirillum itersonii TaxID=189 RepID=A0A7W9ZF98_NOVIT|nr:alanyl-tRNA editing protein [Novispirillum itersonii]MBB6210340.1 misacylated tRNA(Ala) deacylase [Novispirillum itersonii]
MTVTEAVFRETPYAQDCTATVQAQVTLDGPAGALTGVVLDRTVFYVEGGGQPGDSGTLEWDGGSVAITTVLKDRASGDWMHVPEAGASLPPVGTAVTCRIDWDRRHRHMRLHTCLHLLCSLIDAPVTGGSVSAEKARLDFDLDTAPDKDDLTAKLNALIAANHPVTASWISAEELQANPDIVRTMSVKPPVTPEGVRVIRIGESVDFQPCGGTHVQATGEIGPVRVVKMEKKGKLNRRITVEFSGA